MNCTLKNAKKHIIIQKCFFVSLLPLKFLTILDKQRSAPIVKLGKSKISGSKCSLPTIYSREKDHNLTFLVRNFCVEKGFFWTTYFEFSDADSRGLAFPSNILIFWKKQICTQSIIIHSEGWSTPTICQNFIKISSKLHKYIVAISSCNLL